MTISPAAIDAMIAHAREEAPRECCGLLIGSRDRIESARRARNLESSPARFLVDPQDHFAALRAARADGRAVVGVYHSHPSTVALPSPSDLAEASYAEYAYAIVSLASNPPEIRLFRLDRGAFVEVEITQT